MFQEIRIEQLQPSPSNPRKRFDQARLQELADSIATKGIIEPLVVRQVNGHADQFEIVAGERRFRAAKLAQLERVPAVVRELTDQEVLETQVIENLQRDDIHPLEEAAGYAALLKADGAQSAESIAARVGRSTSYVYRMLKLLSLIPDAAKAFAEDRITAAHAVRLARLTPEQQERGLEECFFPILRGLTGSPEDGDPTEPAPVSKLDRWIDSHARINLEADDTQHYFPELAEAVEDTDTDPAAPTLLELSESHMPAADLGTKKHGTLGARRWHEITTAKDRCDHVQRGAIVHGGPPRILEVCATKGCPKHFPVAKRGAKGKGQSLRDRNQARLEKWEREAQEREAKRKAWDALKPKALAAFAEHVKGVQLDAQLARWLLGTDRQHVERVIGKVTDPNAVQALILSAVEKWTREDFLRSVRPFKFNLGTVEQRERAAAKQAKKAAPKERRPAAAKRATTRTAKGGRKK